MDPRLLKYYNQELQHIREMGGEFAKEFPKIASRLGLDSFECADPYVERLLEGFAFLAGRLQLKIDAEFPRFTQHLLEILYPHYLSPTPSVAVVQLHPDMKEGSLNEGFTVPVKSSMRSIMGSDDQTACEYRTAHDVTLWPIEITQATYLTNVRNLLEGGISHASQAKSGLSLRFKTTNGLSVKNLPIKSLVLYLRGNDEISMHLYEQLLGTGTSIVARQPGNSSWQEPICKNNIKPVGFKDSEALLSYGTQSFNGYRLLQEYFLFPKRFMFFELSGLTKAISRCEETEIEIVVLFDRVDLFLENKVDVLNFALFCTPVINLFPKRSDRIHLLNKQVEHHIVPDRTRPLDFEVYSVKSVIGHGTSAEEKQEFFPFYSSSMVSGGTEDNRFFTIHRTPRTISSKQMKYGNRSSYQGNEVFLSLVDAREAPYSSTLRQLEVKILATNRDMPLHMPIGKGQTDFILEKGEPVSKVKCLAGPTKPIPSHAEGETAWRLINHLSLNYLSLMDSDDTKGAHALRELLKLYGDTGDAIIKKQIEGLKSVTSAPIIRPMSQNGPVTFGRGLEVGILFDESSFSGTGIFLLGSVLENFFSKYISINSFTETVVRTVDRGEIMRWPGRTGQRHIL